MRAVGIKLAERSTLAAGARGGLSFLSADGTLFGAAAAGVLGVV